ncbi:hypothetical protein RDI58_027357 [Solanum bulbocastanum]|uniref:Uncharacterized protein n=1 Tax=Solanum bulbocastanum TaxID=147425 RepID=A0AAN8T0M1_SOLBU
MKGMEMNTKCWVEKLLRTRI